MTTENKTFFDQYNEFADACENPRGAILQVPSKDFLDMCLRLVHEEWEMETLPAIDRYRIMPSLENFAEVTDGIVDTVYVLMQLARALGVPFNEGWEEVHGANMKKVVDGKVTRRADGKILKPEGWTPPDIWNLCYRTFEKQLIDNGKKALGD